MKINRRTVIKEQLQKLKNIWNHKWSHNHIDCDQKFYNVIQRKTYLKGVKNYIHYTS